MDLVFVFFPAVMTVIISLLMSSKWKMCEKVDKGIMLCYWKLSYRRKFIRTLWLVPISIIFIGVFYSTFQSIFWSCLIAAVVAIMLLIQAIYNYKKWKK